LSYLFIDSTYNLSLGILTEGLEWLSFQKFSGQKASVVIQKASYELLNTHNIRPENLQGIITINGPGFYTGLRLAEGFADVFSFFGVRNFSFYSYEIPLWLGYQEGTWMTKAYRGEYFFYRWKGHESSIDLIPVKKFQIMTHENDYFIHSQEALDDISLSLIKNTIETSKLLKEFPKEIFKNVITGLKRDPYYFRAPEDEFKVNP
jgi:tRNA threonylcarbamoyladenosine biosynthesis protein TsaB